MGSTTSPTRIGRDAFRVIHDRMGTQFKCPRGHVARMSDAQRRAYERLSTVTVRCEVCDASGIVQDPAACDGPGIL